MFNPFSSGPKEPIERAKDDLKRIVSQKEEFRQLTTQVYAYYERLIDISKSFPEEFRIVAENLGYLRSSYPDVRTRAEEAMQLSAVQAPQIDAGIDEWEHIVQNPCVDSLFNLRHFHIRAKDLKH